MSGINRRLKSTVVHGLHASGATRQIASALRAKGVILTFHEIQDDLDAELWTGCSASLLEACLRWVRRAGLDIISLEEALRRLQRDEPTRRFAVLTFDDGYRDNIVRALPILRREQAPFTTYIPSGAITRELFAWWLGLREIFKTNDKVEISAMGRSFSCADLLAKVRGLASADRWVHQNYACILDLRHTFSRYGISLPSLCDRYFVNENELRLLASEPLCSIGAHTVSHLALATLDMAEASRELVDNRGRLQSWLDREVLDLAYPFGNRRACGPREAKLAAAAGFKTAATTSNRPLFAQDRHDLYTLPRISVHPHWTIARLDAEISGLTVATARRFLASWPQLNRRRRSSNLAGNNANSGTH